MNLSNTNDPKRQIQYHGRSLAACSRKELIECVEGLIKEMSEMEKRLGIAAALAASANQKSAEQLSSETQIDALVE